MLVCNLAEAFVMRGQQATVIALSDAAQIGNDPTIERIMVERLTSAGVSATSLSLRNRRNPVTGARALRGVLTGRSVNVIHAHTAAALPAAALARLRCPVILTHHNSRLSFPPWAFRLFDQTVAGYVAISEECARQTSQYARKPIRRIANAAGANFQATEPRRMPAFHPVILAVGTISTQKDYATLIRAAAPLARRLAEAGRRPLIRIAGGGSSDAMNALQTLAKTEGVAVFIELLGPRSDVEALMADADIFVNCSLWEGFSIAMIEASMSALPIVATNVAGNCEMVLAGQNGALVPPGDPGALADAIATIAGDHAHYAALSVGALASAKRFSLEASVTAHLSYYRDSIALGQKTDKDSATEIFR